MKRKSDRKKSVRKSMNFRMTGFPPSCGAVRAACIFLLVLLLTTLTACGGEEPLKIVLTTGFASDEVFRLEDTACTRSELLVYLTTEQNRYEAVYGTEIWDTAQNAGELEQRLKDKALAEISQVKAMTLLADRRGMTLTAQEEERVTAAAADYLNSLNDTEKKVLGVTSESIEGMYRDYALADKVYREIISDINPEISDDEARTITVQHVLIKTVTVNADGSVTPLSDEEKEKRYRQAVTVQEEAAEGAAFETLIEKYSEDPESTLSFGKGEKEKSFEDVAFNLGKGEISSVVETSEGYEIIKCISTFNREETDRNKLKIVEKRKNEVFGQEYDAFVDSLARNLNEKLWESITLIQEEEVETDQFFEVYREYFPSREEGI